MPARVGPAWRGGSWPVCGGELGGVADEPGRTADDPRRCGRRLTLAGLLKHPGDLGDVHYVELERAGAGASTASAR